MKDNRKPSYQVKESQSNHRRIPTTRKVKTSNGGEKAVAGFEKLWVWQKAYKLMQEVHKFCKTLPREERFRLRDQIERSSSSVCDNISEGYSSYYYNDKIKGFNVARKEAGETQNHIRKLSGKGYLSSCLGISINPVGAASLLRRVAPGRCSYGQTSCGAKFSKVADMGRGI